MLIGAYHNNEMLHTYTDFFMNNIMKKNYMKYFYIYVSDNVIEDAMVICPTGNFENLDDIAGINLLPYKSKDKITILISKDSNEPNTIFHELGHMVDMVDFAKEFCDGDFSLIRRHKYYNSFVYWSEFHVKQIDIPYMQIIAGICGNQTPEEVLKYFKDNIPSFFYDEYAKKLLNKLNISLHNIMWYLGEIVVCNLYDNKKQYYIHQSVIDKHGDILELFEMVVKCLTFEQLVENIDSFHNLILKQKS